MDNFSKSCYVMYETHQRIHRQAERISWTPEMTSKLFELDRKGLSNAQIGVELGGLTMHQVKGQKARYKRGNKPK